MDGLKQPERCSQFSTSGPERDRFSAGRLTTNMILGTSVFLDIYYISYDIYRIEIEKKRYISKFHFWTDIYRFWSQNPFLEGYIPFLERKYTVFNIFSDFDLNNELRFAKFSAARQNITKCSQIGLN